MRSIINPRPLAWMSFPDWCSAPSGHFWRPSHRSVFPSYPGGHLRHLHLNELCANLEKVCDAIVGVTLKDPGLPWCILESGRVFEPFVLFTNEQYVSPSLPSRLHQASLPLLLIFRSPTDFWEWLLIYWFSLKSPDFFSALEQSAQEPIEE